MPQCVIFGEVGLSGEVRAVSKARQRIDESIRMGFTNIILQKKFRGGVEITCRDESDVPARGQLMHRIQNRNAER